MERRLFAHLAVRLSIPTGFDAWCMLLSGFISEEVLGVEALDMPAFGARRRPL
jgi:hypothetical protein